VDSFLSRRILVRKFAIGACDAEDMKLGQLFLIVMRGKIGHKTSPEMNRMLLNLQNT